MTAELLLDDIYKNDTEYELEDSRFSRYNTRRFTHLLKLCLIYAAIAEHKEIGEEDVVMANTTLCYAESFMPLALGQFGRMKNSETADAVFNLIAHADRPMGIDEIFRHVQQDVQDLTELGRMLSNLERGNKVKMAKVGDSIRDVKYILVAKRAQVKKYVDYSLLTAEEQEHVFKP